MSEDPFGPDLKARLRAELDRVQPLGTSPRYLAGGRRPITWRFAPALLAASVISILALSGFVATGSPNPAVWGRDVVTIIQSSSTTPTPPSRPSQTPTTTQPTPAHRGESPEPTEQPEPSESSEPHESPQPSDDHSGEGSGSGGGGDSSGSDGSGSGGGDSRDGGTSDSDDTERS